MNCNIAVLISIKKITDSDPAHHQVLDLRNRLLRLPLGLSLYDEDLSEEIHQTILAAFDEEQLTGCLILQPMEHNVIKLRQMAVEEAAQGKGIGRKLMEYAEEEAKCRGFATIMLHARITAQGFYEKLGYQPYGAIFTEVTIPHIAMKKQIR